VNHVDLPSGTPEEIEDIVKTRQRMLEKILKVSSERLRLVNFIRDTFGRYVSKKVVDEILASPDGYKIGGRRKTVTILMADLRGFTSITETSDPEKTVRLLNRFFGAMAKIITAYDGLIDEFLGDGILTIFGVPERHPDDPARVVACALEMQNALRQLNKEFTQEGFPALEMGIGINTGSVIVGNIGSDIRSKYGIIGIPVNTASRIESITTGGQVFIGEPTYRLVQSGVQVDKPQTVMMKGLKEPLICFPVKSIYSPFQVNLETSEKKSQQIELQLSFTCWQIDGKKIVEPAMAGQTVAVAEDIWQVAVTPPLEPLTDVKLQLNFCAEAHCFEAIYAKVLKTESRGSEVINHLRITSIQPDDRTIITHWTEAVEA
jgi:class 3 adenylate cyclase